LAIISFCICGAERARQTRQILLYGYPVDNPCKYCSHYNQGCIMDSKNHNCAVCTKRGHKCEKRFYNNKKWEQFEKDKIETIRQLNKVLAEQAKLATKIT
jgi:hypothetical protein